MEESTKNKAVDWEVVAYHEAGHAVVATVLGFETEMLKLTDPAIPADKLATKADFHGPRPNTTEEARQSTVNRAIYLEAGRLAEVRGAARACPDAWPADDQQIDWWYDLLSSGGNVAPKDQFIADARSCAEALLAEHWSAVEVIAQELLRSRELDGRLLRQKVQEATSSRPVNQENLVGG